MPTVDIDGPCTASATIAYFFLSSFSSSSYFVLKDNDEIFIANAKVVADAVSTDSATVRVSQ